jgi:DNA-binding winged helix-turn-helix (wHTH) protein
MASFRFASFELDPGNRRLGRDGVPVELNARYLDALALLVGEQGQLISKDRFLDEVWRGIPVTDEALTQCIKTLRRQLGDDAANPRFIETVPKHGYRFIAGVESGEGAAAVRPRPVPAAYSWRDVLQIGGAGTIGGAVAGLVGGLIYGFAGASQAQAGVGALSVLLVLVVVTMAVGLVGGAGVGFGIAAAGFAPERGFPWAVAGGALGGLLVGALVKLVWMDAFTLLVGQSPGDITGAPEGVLIGAAVGLGTWLAFRGANPPSPRRAVAMGALATGVVGVAIPLLGGQLLLGSLDSLARQFPDSRLRLIGGLFGASGLNTATEAALGLLEGGLFGGCVVAAIIAVRRGFRAEPQTRAAAM